MIGFFEHQYLSFKKSHLLNLIALAKSDGHFHQDEEELIYKVGERYGLKVRQIASLINNFQNDDLHIPKSHGDKMNQLYDLIKMVYLDGKVEEKEIQFCQDLMVKYGFKKEIVPWMLEIFEQGHLPYAEEWESMKRLAQEKFLD